MVEDSTLEKKPRKSHKCQRKGHYASQYRSKPIAVVYEDESENKESSVMDSAFLGNISTMQKSAWKTQLLLHGKEVEFKIDTGAEVMAISSL